MELPLTWLDFGERIMKILKDKKNRILIKEYILFLQNNDKAGENSHTHCSCFILVQMENSSFS